MASPTKNSLRQVLAKNVQKERRKRGLTQTALAQLAGTSQKTISEVESCLKSTGVDIIEGIAKGFGIGPEQLLKARKDS